MMHHRRAVHMLAVILAVLTFGSVHAAGTLEDRVFHSNTLNADKHVMVYLPQGYNPNGNIYYPVVYFLHGAFANYNTSASMIKSVLDGEIGSGRIQPLIVAMPSGAAGAFGGSMWANSDLYGRFEDYLEDDVRQFMETNYKVIAARSKRAIIGHSMGGMGAFNSAFRHAELYCAAASHSGALDYQHLLDYLPLIYQEAGGIPPYNYDPNNGTFTDLFFLVAGAWSPNLSNPPFYVEFPLDATGAVIDSVYHGKWMPNGPQRLARRLLGGPNLAIWFDCGTADDLHLYPFNTAFDETLAVLGIPHQFLTISGGHHNVTPAQLALSFGFADSVMQSGSASVDDLGPRRGSFSNLRITPTPSHGPVTISFLMDRKGFGTLDIMDVTGRRVASLLDGELASGAHEVTWDRQGSGGMGVYFVRMSVPGRGVVSTRIVLAR
jgi:S-formylglutathione hydrolase FrmB